MKISVGSTTAIVSLVALSLSASPVTPAGAAPTTGDTAAKSSPTAPSARDTAAKSGAGSGTAYSTAANAPPPTSGTIALSEVPDAKNNLSSVKIVDLKGDSVGSVDDVMFDNMGKPRAVKVDVGGFLGIGGKDVALDANAVKFDPAKKVLVTSLNKDQLKALPEIKG